MSKLYDLLSAVIGKIAKVADEIPAVDTTLTVKGAAADAKAVGDALDEKALKSLHINANGAPSTGETSPSGIPIFTIDYTPSDLKAYRDNGATVTLERWGTIYTLISAYNDIARFEYTSVTQEGVVHYSALLDTEKQVTITRVSFTNEMEETNGGAVGKIPRIKTMNNINHPGEWEFVDLPKSAAVADAAGDTPTAEEFNALLAALRSAGLMAAE